MGYRVATRVVSAAEVGGSHTRERLFILAHTDVQRVGQQSVHCGHGERGPVQNGFEPDRQPSRDQECRQRLDIDVGPDDSRRLVAPALPVFPPIPSDFAEWGKALERSPQLKPCIHGLDDGVAFGLDRSGAAGNGVVSLAAAHAYCALRVELGN